MSNMEINPKEIEYLDMAVSSIKQAVSGLNKANKAIDTLGEAVQILSKQIEPQKIFHEVELYRKQVDSVSDKLNSAIEEMKRFPQYAEQATGEVSTLCNKSNTEWMKLRNELKTTCEILKQAGEQVNGISQAASVTIGDAEVANRQLTELISTYTQVRRDIQDGLSQAHREMLAFQQETRDIKIIYTTILEDVRATRTLAQDIKDQKDKLWQMQHDDTQSLKELMGYYRILLDEQKQVCTLIRAQQEATTSTQVETKALLSLVEALKEPDEMALVKVYEGFEKWMESKQATKVEVQGEIDNISDWFKEKLLKGKKNEKNI